MTSDEQIIRDAWLAGCRLYDFPSFVQPKAKEIYDLLNKMERETRHLIKHNGERYDGWI